MDLIGIQGMSKDATLHGLKQVAMALDEWKLYSDCSSGLCRMVCGFWSCAFALIVGDLLNDLYGYILKDSGLIFGHILVVICCLLAAHLEGFWVVIRESFAALLSLFYGSHHRTRGKGMRQCLFGVLE
eukprot:644988_1